MYHLNGYKKSLKGTVIRSRDFAEDQKDLMAFTLTGEPFQPVRLHYMLSDPKTVKRELLSLKCVADDGERLVWNYCDEASGIKFSKTSFNIRPDQSVVIGSIYFDRTFPEMVIECRSFKRGVEAIRFFGEKIQSGIRLQRFRFVHRLFSASEVASLKGFGELFEKEGEEFGQDILAEGLEALESRLTLITYFEIQKKAGKDPMEAFRKLDIR